MAAAASARNDLFAVVSGGVRANSSYVMSLFVWGCHLSSHDMGTRPWLTCVMVKGEHDLERREAEVAAREAALAERMEASDAILGAASERDASGDARDAAAEKREKETDLSHLLDTEPNPVYGDDWPQRRNAQLDRQHAKSDREASQDDRIALTAGDAEHRGDET